MNVYFARSLRGDRFAGDDAIYRGIVAAIKGAGHRTQFELPVTINRNGFSDSEYVYQRDLAWIDKCEAMIAEVTNASHGVGFEIGYAVHISMMHVLCVYQKDTLISAMIAGCADIERLEYRDLGDLTAYIQTWLTNTNTENG